ncbi:MAG: hypothetical protein R2880_10055 [Deinococcales bacterium]
MLNGSLFRVSIWYNLKTVIRHLSADELEWFLASSYRFLGHSDPWAFAKRSMDSLQAETAMTSSFILLSDKAPLAGVHIQAPKLEADEKNLYLSNFWFHHQASDLSQLISKLLDKYPHEAVYAPLYNVSAKYKERLKEVFLPLGFRLEPRFDLEFDLAELPPIGMPLVLEAWDHTSDRRFRHIFSQAEGIEVSERYWAYLKRQRGKFNPELWFLAHETLDQAPVGYALYGLYRQDDGGYIEGIDGRYYLSAIGALKKFRGSSDMLRRLLISSMQELAARSPLGRLYTSSNDQDPKLINIYRSVGFELKDRYDAFVKRPQ